MHLDVRSLVRIVLAQFAVHLADRGAEQVEISLARNGHFLHEHAVVPVYASDRAGTSDPAAETEPAPAVAGATPAGGEADEEPLGYCLAEVRDEEDKPVPRPLEAIPYEYVAVCGCLFLP